MNNNQLPAYWKKLRSIYPNSNSLRLFVITAILGLIIPVLAAKGFVELTEAMNKQLFDDWDFIITAWFHQMRSPGLSELMIACTQLGSIYGYLVIITGISWYIWKKKKNWLLNYQILLVLISAGLLNFILKFLIDRERPPGANLIEAGGQSFPSGHAMSSMVFYGFLVYLLWIHLEVKRLKIFLSFILIVVVILIGISRIYLGVHYPSDIVAGYIAGLGWLALMIGVFNWINHNRLKKQHSDK